MIIPLIYPIRILVSLLVNIIPEPFDIRNVVLMIAVPLVVIRRKTGLFLFFYGALSIAPISEQAGWKIPARISAGEREYGFCLGRRQIYRRQ